MRRVFVLAFLFLIIFSAVSRSQKDKFEGSVFFTPGFTSISGGQQLNTNPRKPFIGKFGFSAGISVSRNISKDVFIKMGLQYNNKGSRYRFITSDLLSGGFFHINYIEIPFMIGVEPSPEFRWLKIEAGFSYGLLLYRTPFFSTEVIDYTLSEIKTHDVSFIADCLFPINKKTRDHLSLGPSFSHSLMRINPNYNFYNYCFGLMMNYRI
jgi:hypothetical protein